MNRCQGDATIHVYRRLVAVLFFNNGFIIPLQKPLGTTECFKNALKKGESELSVVNHHGLIVLIVNAIVPCRFVQV